MDANEIARLRLRSAALTMAEALTLLDALEQAQKEQAYDANLAQEYAAAARDAEAEPERAETLRDAAQQDAKDARALLVETQELCESVRMLPLPVGAHAEALRARIEAMLEHRP